MCTRDARGGQLAGARPGRERRRGASGGGWGKRSFVDVLKTAGEDGAPSEKQPEAAATAAAAEKLRASSKEGGHSARREGKYTPREPRREVGDLRRDDRR